MYNFKDSKILLHIFLFKNKKELYLWNQKTKVKTVNLSW